MISDLEYAVLARNAYDVARPNDIELPGWREVEGLNRGGWGGFAATVFQKGGEVVISFRGTDGESFDWDLIVDFLNGNVPAALGISGISSQIQQAIWLVSDVQDKFPSASISFTGHSLGGGLAAVMGVLFNKPAVTFAQAPFRESLSSLVGVSLYYEVYELYQLITDRAVDPQIAAYVANVQAHGTDPGDPSLLVSRSTQIHDYSIAGEILSLAFDPALRVGIPGLLDAGATPLASTFDGQVSLHSIELHAALVGSPKLSQAMVANPFRGNSVPEHLII